VKAAVGEGTADAFVEEKKQERDLNTFGGEPVGIAGRIVFLERETVPAQPMMRNSTTL
jgi:hypothetical protein